MKKILKKLLQISAVVLFAVLSFSPVAFADTTVNNWVKTSITDISTNTGNGLANANIHVAGCYIGVGFGTPCGSVGGGVTSLNSLTGALDLIAGNGISITEGASTFTFDFTGVTTDGTTIIGDGVNNPLSAITQQSGKGILTGGAVWSGTGFIFDVTTLTYFIDGVTYGPTAATQVTLDPSDPTDDRIDYIVVDDNGTVSVVTGTPGDPPAAPELAWNEVPITFVVVEAGSTTPSIPIDLTYDENTGPPTEWAPTTYNVSGAQAGTVIFNGSTSPYSGTVDAQATGTNLRRGMRFTRGTDINIQQFGYLALAFRIDTAVLPTAKSPIIRFQNSGGTLIGNNVNLVTYGLNRNTVGTWQVVVIPVTAFGNITNVRSLTALVNGAGNANWSMDKIYLSGGIPPQSNLGPIFLAPTGTLYSSGAAQQGGTAATDSLFFGNFAGYGAQNADDSFFWGEYAGAKAINANNSIFIGKQSGYLADSAFNSNFLGNGAGYLASSAQGSNFFGYNSGYNASSAQHSNFLGYESGSVAANAEYSNFFGYRSGKGAFDANNSIFIGKESGLNDTVSNGGTDFSVLIGPSTSTGGFSNSIAIGGSSTNTAVNQLMIGSVSKPINDARIIGTGGLVVPIGTTGERIPVQGMIRYNTTTSKFEGYDGTTWQDFH